jgi:hypothetical protein
VAVAEVGLRHLVSMVGLCVANRRTLARLTVILLLPRARSNLLALILVAAADIIRTVAISPTCTRGGALERSS